MSKMTTLYHGTSSDVLDKILKEGIKGFMNEVYLTTSVESAWRWVAMRHAGKKDCYIAVIEVRVDKKKISPGTDHSPMMKTLFGVGKSLVHEGIIPPEQIKNVYKLKLTKEEPLEV